MKLTEASLPDLGSLPQRLRIVENSTTKDRLAACFRRAAELTEEKGIDFANAWIGEKQDKLRALRGPGRASGRKTGTTAFFTSRPSAAGAVAASPCTGRRHRTRRASTA